MYDVIIIGAGTAGMSAAIYTLRAGKSVLILEASVHGGQIINTPEIENYPGIQNISGYEFATDLFNQAMALGAEIKYEKVEGINSFATIVTTDKGKYGCKAIIIATGTNTRKLGLEHEDDWIGSGISYCATCDGAFYRDKDVAVNGGGSTALEDALFLSNYCSKVYVVHRRDEFRGEYTLVQELKAKDNVEFVLNSNITSLLGENSLEGITVENNKDGSRREIPVSGLFIAIGRTPNNEQFKDLIKLDESGFIISDEGCRTNLPGVFAAGDCRTKAVRPLVTAARDGAIAALAACRYIG